MLSAAKVIQKLGKATSIDSLNGVWLFYSINAVEGYHRHLHKVINNKRPFPTEQAVRQLLYLATLDITKKWTASIQNWPLILNQLTIPFED